MDAGLGPRARKVAWTSSTYSYVPTYLSLPWSNYMYIVSYLRYIM